jgi:hypothetical protein
VRAGLSATRRTRERNRRSPAADSQGSGRTLDAGWRPALCLFDVQPCVDSARGNILITDTREGLDSHRGPTPRVLVPFELVVGGQELGLFNELSLTNTVDAIGPEGGPDPRFGRLGGTATPPRAVLKRNLSDRAALWAWHEMARAGVDAARKDCSVPGTRGTRKPSSKRSPSSRRGSAGSGRSVRGTRASRVAGAVPLEGTSRSSTASAGERRPPRPSSACLRAFATSRRHPLADVPAPRGEPARAFEGTGNVRRVPVVL